jgi:LCP family protein required for cell wall assembly
MSEDNPWQAWYQDSKPSADVPPAGAAADANSDRTSYQMPGYPDSGGSGGYSGGYSGDAAGRAWPAQPPPNVAPGRGAPGRGAPGRGVPGSGVPGSGVPRAGRRWRFWGQPGRRGRRIALIIGVIVLVLIAGTAGSYFWINGKLNRTVALPAFTGQSAGTNWLIAGSDSRQGLSRSQIDADHVGFDEGTLNSDSIMLLHLGSGRPVLISIPRDSYVPIPGHGDNKINAALAYGGPSLLIQTVESVTGLRINHYMGIGFGGLVSVVNSVGGVRVCLKTGISDSYSGVNLSKGCHNLSGTQALAFVRDRHSFADSDLQRIQDQRAFLKALLSKATGPGVYLNPFVSLPFASTAASSISVDKGTSLYDLLQAAFALRNPQTGTVPIANADLQTSAGDSVEWNQAEALKLFDALQENKPVPAGLLTGTTVG